MEERDRAWRILYDQNFDCIFRLVCSLGCPVHEAEDVIQRVFMIAHRKMKNGPEVQFINAWLRAVAVRVVAEQRRWRRVRQVKDWLLRSTTHARGAAADNPESRVAAQQTVQLVSEVLSRMSPKLREVLVLLDLEQCSLEETAVALDIPANTVRSRRRLARERFAELWRKHAGEEEARDR